MDIWVLAVEVGVGAGRWVFILGLGSFRVGLVGVRLGRRGGRRSFLGRILVGFRWRRVFGGRFGVVDDGDFEGWFFVRLV